MSDETCPLSDGACGSTALLEIDEERLQAVLQDHARWVQSGGAAGRRANLRRTHLRGRALAGADLRGANLSGADLSGADLSQAQLETPAGPLPEGQNTALAATDLRGASLRGADLERANLQGANLAAANLGEANLDAARLWDTDLRQADLRGARGLLAAQLGGADTTQARLPYSLLPLEGKTNILTASQTADRLFLSMLLACAYGALTIASTTDAGLLGNSTSSRLPIIGTEISVVPFYGVAPLLLVGLYVYLHVYLQDVWEELAALPAVFPDGTPLHRKMYPWLLGNLPRAYWWRLRSEHTLVSDLQLWLSHGAAWCAVPLTLMLFWWRYLSRLQWLPRPWLPEPFRWIPCSTDGLLSLWQLLLITVAIGWGYHSYRLTKATLCRDERELRLWRRTTTQRWRPGRAAWGTLAVVLVLGATAPIWMKGRKAVLTHGILNGIELDGAALQHADLGESQLEGTNLTKALLRSAYLGNARLQGANLDEAQLQDAHLEAAQLQGAHLKATQLQGAHLEDAELQGAHLREASLARADLSGADLAKCDLQQTDLRESRLEEAHLQKAHLTGAQLDGADLGEAQLEKADLEAHEDDHIPAASLRNARLDNTDLEGAQLDGVDLRGAYCTGSDLRGASLAGTDLRGADLRQTQITQTQLDTAVTDATTKVTPPLRVHAGAHPSG
jgi:uncharacterized protein YjbI with pentapeptide repeats